MQAELSSIHSSLQALSERVSAMAQERDIDPEDPVAVGLFEVDRHLRTAVRQLDRVRSRLR